MDKVLGNINKFLGRALEIIFEFIISLLEVSVNVLNSGRKIIGAFGFILAFAIFNPFIGILILLNKWFWIIVFLFFIVPILGQGLINFLRYGQYVITEFFYDRADFYLSDKKGSYKSFGEYAREYERQQEEARQRQYEKQARAEQERWEQAFRDFYNRTGGYGNYQGRADWSGRSQSGSYGNVYDPTADFVKKYEESCRILGLAPTTDKYEIKLAYRKKAKEYHPDINKAENSTQIFQKINEANSFLSDENIERYKSIKESRAN